MFIELIKPNGSAQGFNIDNIEYINIDGQHIVSASQRQLAIEVFLIYSEGISRSYSFLADEHNIKALEPLYKQNNGFAFFSKLNRQKISESLLNTEAAFIFRKEYILQYTNQRVTVKSRWSNKCSEAKVLEKINEIHDILINHSQIQKQQESIFIDNKNKANT